MLRWLVSVALALLVTACGASRTTDSAPVTTPAPATAEQECLERLVCNAPHCSCPEGYRCQLNCTEPRPGCAECVPR